MTLEEKIFAIKDAGWGELIDNIEADPIEEPDEYEEEVNEAYKIMKDETSSNIDMFPNGHDDGEDYDY